MKVFILLGSGPCGDFIIDCYQSEMAAQVDKEALEQLYGIRELFLIDREVRGLPRYPELLTEDIPVNTGPQGKDGSSVSNK